MIEVKNLTKRYGTHTAVDNISFSVKEGEIIGFLGPNGAGKSTTMNILTGYLSSSDGVVTVNGHDILTDANAAKASIGYLPELPPLYPDMTVREYLNFMYDLKKCKLPRAQHIEEICRVVKLEGVFGRLIKNLSKGYRQRVGIAQALIGNPPVLILDEPTVGLDPMQIIEIRSLIKSLGKYHTVILSSHILPEVEAVCDRLVIINGGKIVADATPEELTRQYSSSHHLTARIAGAEESVTDLIAKIRGVKKVTSLGSKEPGSFDYLIEQVDGADVRAELFNRLATRKWPLLSLKTADRTLEDIFTSLIQAPSLAAGTKGGNRK
ncbi:MAG: ATP-binding cassette domain-containing protein [Clostridia bacterium]|nr:ATP-binding cassette domain-containing protein [Clostridia bacterium]